MNHKTYTFTYETKPTEKNIYYMFERLVLPIIISTQYTPYKEYWNDYEKLLSIIKKWIGTYYNTKDLTKIDNIKEFDEVETIILDLMDSCFMINSKYIEEIDIWHGEFLQMWKGACINKKGDNK